MPNNRKAANASASERDGSADRREGHGGLARSERRGRSERMADEVAPRAHRTAKVVELVATSTRSFEDAIANAVEDAAQATRGITGLHVQNMSVRCRDGRIEEYRVHCKVAFGVEHAPGA